MQIRIPLLTCVLWLLIGTLRAETLSLAT